MRWRCWLTSSFRSRARCSLDICAGSATSFDVTRRTNAALFPAMGPDVCPGSSPNAVPTNAEVPVTIEGDLGAPITAVTVTEGAVEPTEPTATVIATGTGAPLAAGDTINLQYTLSTWDNANTETTWPPDGIGISSATLGQGSIFDQLVDVPGGSRVLFQVPGDAASGSPALAVVVDVIGE